MIIVIAPEQPVGNESFWINQFFEKGLNLFHIRKYGLSDAAMQAYIDAVDSQYRKQLVLHSHFHLAADFGVKRVHFKEQDRIQKRHLPFQDDYTISTSVHSIVDFNTLDTQWTYAFFSPVFPSISKSGYGLENNVLDDLKFKNNVHVRLIGLGGIHENNVHKTIEAGADGVALLGSVWGNKNPLNTFLKCKEIDQLY